MTDSQAVFLKIALDSWNTYLKRTEKLLAELTDEQLETQVAPDRNRGVYLLGHLVAVHDGMLPLFNLGEKSYPELEEPFLKNADTHQPLSAGAAILRTYWKELHTKLNQHFASFSLEQWMEKHASVSEEAFAKEPHRNRLNVLVNRSHHLAYHYGQLVFLRPRA